MGDFSTTTQVIANAISRKPRSRQLVFSSGTNRTSSACHHRTQTLERSTRCCRTLGEMWLLGCTPSPKSKHEDTDFVHTMLSNVSTDIPFSWNHRTCYIYMYINVVVTALCYHLWAINFRFVSDQYVLFNTTAITQLFTRKRATGFALSTPRHHQAHPL